MVFTISSMLDTGETGCMLGTGETGCMRVQVAMVIDLSVLKNEPKVEVSVFEGCSNHRTERRA